MVGTIIIKNDAHTERNKISKIEKQISLFWLKLKNDDYFQIDLTININK